MKKVLLFLILLIPYCGSSQDISGSWSWQAEKEDAHMEIFLKAEGSEFIGHHCAVFQDGDRIDCVDEDQPASIIIKRTAESEFEGTITSGYSASEGKIKLLYDSERKTLLFEILKPPGDIYYLPKRAMFNSKTTKNKGIPEEEIRINGKICYTTTSSQLLEDFGDPLKVEEEYWEMSEENIKKYSYPGADFFFAQDELESFKLHSSDWSLITKKLNLEVGSSIDTLSTYYPEAYSKRKKGYLAIPIGTGDYIFLLIKYNPQNIITAIEQRIY